MLKENKGITLVALVITIIVLLILAGVTISLVLGDKGILNNAKDAQKKQEMAYAEEMVGIALKSVEMDEAINSVVGNKTDALQAALGNTGFAVDATITSDKGTVVYTTKTNQKITVTVNYKNYSVDSVSDPVNP